MFALRAFLRPGLRLQKNMDGGAPRAHHFTSTRLRQETRKSKTKMKGRRNNSMFMHELDLASVTLLERRATNAFMQLELVNRASAMRRFDFLSIPVCTFESFRVVACH